MKTALTALLILFLGIQSQAHMKNKEQLFQIHKAVLKSINSDGVSYGVYKRTQKNFIGDLDFHNPDGLDTSASNIWKKPQWKAFLNRIDTATLANYPLSTNDKSWFKSIRKSKRAVVFAPVMVSDDGTMALSIMMFHNQLGQPASSRVYFLEKEEGKWVIKQDRMLVLID